MRVHPHYYNEFDKYAAQWLRNLIAAGHIAPGDVDERSISDVRPADLAGYTQCHFFAGIGGWSLALRLAGWPDDRPVWTGSCPCQPFSVAGAGHGVADERHLWPHWFHLVRAVRPPTVFGEQVEAAINHGWLDLVQDDLEGEGYAFAPVGIPAAGVGAPHIRQRLWFVADHHHQRSQGREPVRQRTIERAVGPGRMAGELGNPERHGLVADQVRREVESCEVGSGVFEHQRPGSNCIVGVPNSTGPQSGWQAPETSRHRGATESTGQWDDGTMVNPSGKQVGIPGRAWESRGSGYWTPCDWLPCRDGKWRPVEPGTFPLAHGVSNRVGRLRAYGNAIVPQVAAEVIRAYMECRPC